MKYDVVLGLLVTITLLAEWVEGLCRYRSDGDLWDYDRTVLGPRSWWKRFPTCGKRRQSPINIVTSQVRYDNTLGFFDLDHYNHTASFHITTKLQNSWGRTVKMRFSGQPITIRDGGLRGAYVLRQFHFHWGRTRYRGSEHLVDNQQAPLEMHLVHTRKSPSDNISEELAVLGFLFKIGKHNPEYVKLLSYFKDVTYRDEHVLIPPFRLSKMLPPNLDRLRFYRYSGSLTTPPCSETVIWSVFKDKIEISEKQLQKFRSLKAVRATRPRYYCRLQIADNFRPVQKLNGRQVTSNFQPLTQQ